jgi:23S rRNA pseudouridine2604 synthase
VGIRINKYIRDKGLASRREADALVESGAVFINGVKAELGSSVEEADSVEIRQEEKEKKTNIYRAYYKPRGIATQAVEGPDVVTEWKKRGLYPVGRLDKDSEGLLIMTNDGRLTTKLLGVESDIDKEYFVKVREELKNNVPALFAKGMETEPFGKLLPAHAELLGTHSLQITLLEGKKHQIRVMLGELGYTTVQLKRVRVGPILLGDLKPGADRDLTQKELTDLGII